MRFLALRARNDKALLGKIENGRRREAPPLILFYVFKRFVIPSPEGARNLNQFVIPTLSDKPLRGGKC